MSGDSSNRVAVVGMAGRFPDARDPDAFWRNLRNGVRSIRRCGDEPATGGAAGDLIPVVARLARPHAFDADFFGMSEATAEITDPQHRLFLECCWEAVENAGYAADGYPGVVGVFGGCSFPTYLLSSMARRPELVEECGPIDLVVANDRDSLTSRVSYQLNLVGPSVTVQTFSSTSLVAVHLASQSLLCRESDLALAGASVVKFPRQPGYRADPSGYLSATGECRCFDARADGTVIGDTVAVVALKRLSDAVAAGDHIYATIIGTAVNADGGPRASYLTPRRRGRAAVIAEALANAGVSANDVGYLETGSLGTPLGDAIELAAMADVFGDVDPTNRPDERCSIGALAANIGHPEGASGVAGLIKTSMMLRDRWIPPQVACSEISPSVAVHRELFTVNTKGGDWTADDGSRVAGVSSFGLGGVNAHVVLAEPPTIPVRPTAELAGAHLLVLSARNPTALEQATQRLADFVTADADTELADIAFTLQAGRTEFEYRRALVCADRDDALAALSCPARREDRAVRMRRPSARSLLVVAPDDWPHAEVAEVLRERSPLFRAASDECASVFGRDPMPDGVMSRAVRYSLGTLLRALVPDVGAFTGTGAGAAVAGRLAGWLSLDTALTTNEVPDIEAVAEQAIAMDAIGPADPFADLCRLAGRLWLGGTPLHWPALHGYPRRRVPLPGYPFQRRRYRVSSRRSGRTAQT